MTLDELKDSWEKDCQIDSHHLDDESLKTVNLHAKYLRLLIDARMKKSALQLDYKTKRQLRFRFYRGELTQEELAENKWEQYQGIKPIKNVMDELLDGDDILNRIAIKIEYVETHIYFLESVMHGIKSRGWDIKNAIEFKKFLSGV
jgi:hypothetical protein